MAANTSTPDWPPGVEILNDTGRSPLVLICEHASNHIPAEYARLGLDDRRMARSGTSPRVKDRLPFIFQFPAIKGRRRGAVMAVSDPWVKRDLRSRAAERLVSTGIFGRQPTSCDTRPPALQPLLP